MAKFSPMKQANQVLNQVKVGLHTVPVENNARMLPHSHTHHQFPGHYPSHMVPQQQQQQQEQHYQSQQQGQQHQQQIHHQPQSQHQQHHSQHQPQQQSHHIEQTQQQQDQNLIENVWHFSLQAIDRLDKWRGSDDKLGFFSLCLRPLIIQEPGIRRNVPELDHRLAMVIHQIIDDAAASITAKENAVLQERANQLLRRQELEQLRADLDRREVELRRQEAMALTLSEHQPRSHSPAGDPRATRYAEERPHARHLTPTKLAPNAAPLPAGQCTHFQDNEQNEGGAAAAREGADINYVCPQCEMEASAVTFNSVEFLQGEQAGEQPQDALMDGESLEESTNGINQQW
ncbi:putative mediator of RNA polymerase II transcription subunit 26 [Drosophila subobscura]|uniref:putative mediator of RNA polymerase II transcription subunit 26 n=1 Tax=Drosophila subobscura TaxID=7241 RepID=UPI00155A3200|nr:putative mediator of RNA polymerase II transcription subunit 26 [Drosophila subobscura]